MDEKRLNVTTEDGTEMQIDVIDIVTAIKANKEYIFYSIVGKDGVVSDDIFASILDEKEDSYTLKTIVDEEEWNFANDILDEISNSNIGE